MVAQIPTPESPTEVPSERLPGCAAPVPFGVGERLDFSVRLGPVGVGEASVAVAGQETVRGHRTYLLEWNLEGGVPLYRVDDHYRSWMDVRTLSSRRFIQDIHHGRRERLRHFELYPEERRYDFVDREEGLELLSNQPLDDISFVFWARTLPLEVGDDMTFNHYFREHGNPVSVQVLRREEVEVPAGTFQALVVRPIIRSGGLWDEDAEAAVYFSDDERRLPLRIRLRASVVGTLTLSLESYSPGVPLLSAC